MEALFQRDGFVLVKYRVEIKKKMNAFKLMLKLPTGLLQVMLSKIQAQ